MTTSEHASEDRAAAYASFAQNRGISIKPPKRPRSDQAPVLNLVEPEEQPQQGEPVEQNTPEADQPQPRDSRAAQQHPSGPSDPPPAEQAAATQAADGGTAEKPAAVERAEDLGETDSGGEASRFGTRRYGQRAVDTTLSVTLAKKVKDAARNQSVSRGEILIEAIRSHHRTLAQEAQPEPERDDDPFAGLGAIRGRSKVAEGGVSVKLQFYVPPAFAERIADLAGQLNMTPSGYMRSALEAWAKR